MITYAAWTIAGKIRLDIYGEVQEAGRIAVFLSPEDALLLSRDLGARALALGARKETDDAEDLV